MTRFYWILGVVAVVGIGAVGYSVGSAGAGDGPATSPVEIEGLDDPQRLVQMAQGVVKGDEDAPFTIVEFADFQCPACQTFSNLVMSQVMDTYIETGEAKLVFYDYPIPSLHRHAFLAARAARCASDQDAYWDYHDELFEAQQEWAFTQDPTDLFVGYAEELGLDAGAFESCLESDRHADVVTANMRLGQELGVGGTPTVMVSGGAGMTRRVNNNTFQAIAQAIRELRAASAGETGAEGETGGGAGGADGGDQGG